MPSATIAPPPPNRIALRLSCCHCCTLPSTEAIARDEQDQDQRQHEDDVVEQQIADARVVRGLIVQQSEHHQVGPAGAREFTHPDQSPQHDGGRNRGALHEHCHPVVRRLGDRQLDRKCRKEFIRQIDQAEQHQQRRAHAGHEVRRVEQMQGLQQSEPDEEVDEEQSDDVSDPDLQHVGAQLPDAQQKRHGQQQDRERAGIYAVDERRHGNEGQQPPAAVACAPEGRRTGAAELEHRHGRSEQDTRCDDERQFPVHGVTA